MNGKGDRYRPVDRKKYDENYEAIFGKRVKDSLEHVNKKHGPALKRMGKEGSNDKV